MYSRIAVGIPVFLSEVTIMTRLGLRHLLSEQIYQREFLSYTGSSSLIAVLCTIVVLLASQG